MIRSGLQVLVVAWIALLAAGVSISGKPVLGPVGRLAKDALGALSLRPGMSIFKNSLTERKLVAHCVFVNGTAHDGSQLKLYAPECPPRGHRFGTDARDLLVQRIVRSIAGTPLPHEGDVVDRRSSRAVRRLAALGDYFCHSPLVHDQSLARIAITQQRITRDIRDGSVSARPPFACRFECDPQRLVSPRCTALEDVDGEWAGRGKGAAEASD